MGTRPPDRALVSASDFLRWLAREFRRPVGISIGYGVLSALAQALIPAGIGAAIDRGVEARATGPLLAYACAVLALGTMQGGAGILRDRYALFASLGANFRTTGLVTRQATHMGVELAAAVSRGEAMTVGVADVTQIGRVLEILAFAGAAVVTVVVVAAVMLTASWQLGLIVLAGVPLVLTAANAMIRPLHRRQTKLRKQQPALTARIVDIVNGLRVLRGIGGEETFARRYRQDSQNLRAAGARVARVEADLGALQLLMPALLLALVAWVGARFLAHGRITPGQLVAFYAYALLLQTPLRLLTTTSSRITKGLVAAERVVQFLSQDKEQADTNGSTIRLPEAGDLVDPVSGLRVPSGKFVAVVCPAARDVIELVQRLGGHHGSPVTYGGVPVRECPTEELRRRILVGGNDAFLFSGTLRSELDPAGRARGAGALLERAVDVAMLRDVIDELPAGLDSEIVKSGAGFSGGQQQRMRLARALMADPEVLLLVEPTNAVDVHTEAAIGTRLRQARAGRTTVVFTTSPVLLEQADEVVYVADGKVAPTGLHQGLTPEDGYRLTATRRGDDGK